MHRATTATATLESEAVTPRTAQLYRQRNEDLNIKQQSSQRLRRWKELWGGARSSGRLELRGAALGPKSAQALVQGLLDEEDAAAAAQPPWLVDLEGNELGDRGAVAVAELVRQSATLVWLGLGSNGIGPVGGVALAEALRDSATRDAPPSLTALDLSSNGSTCRRRNGLGRTVRDGEPIAPPPTTAELEAALAGGLSERGRPRSAPAGAGLPRAGAASSAPVLLPSEWEVAPGPPDALLQRLKEGYLLTPAEVRRLEAAAEVAAVYEEGDAGFARAAKKWRLDHDALLAELPRAAASQAPHRRARARALARASSARSMPPEPPAVAVALVALAEACAACPTLAVLKLGGNGIDAAGAAELGPLLRGSDGLSELSLPHNGLGAAGATALAPAVAASASLLTLDLAHNAIGDAGVIALVAALHGAALGVPPPPSSAPAAAATASAPAGAEPNDAAGGGAGGGAPAAAVQRRRGGGGGGGDGGGGDGGGGGRTPRRVDPRPLTALDLSANGLTPHGAEALAAALGRGLARLTTLGLKRNSLLPGGAAALAAALAAPGAVAPGTAGAQGKGRGGGGGGGGVVSALTSLDVSECHVACEGAAALARAVRDGAALRWLDLSSNGVRDAGAAALAAAVAGSGGGDHGGGHGRAAPLLQALTLSKNEIGERGGEALGRALPHCRLRALRLRENNLASAAGVAILRGLDAHAAAAAAGGGAAAGASEGPLGCLCVLEVEMNELPFEVGARIELRLGQLRRRWRDTQGERCAARLGALQTAKGALGATVEQLAAVAAAREAHEARASQLEATLAAEEAEAAAAIPRAAEAIKEATRAARQAEDEQSKASSASLMARAGWRSEKDRLETSLIATERRATTLAAEVHRAARGERAAARLLLAEVEALRAELQTAEERAATAATIGDFRLTKLKDKAKELKRAGIAAAVPEVPQHLLADDDAGAPAGVPASAPVAAPAKPKAGGAGGSKPRSAAAAAKPAKKTGGPKKPDASASGKRAAVR